MKPRSPFDTYDDRWLSELDDSSAGSARKVVPKVLQLVRARSVVDVGCGLGTWLAAFSRHGIDDLLGIDGPWIDPARLHIAADRFLAHDLSEPIRLERSFDLAVALEVAEHLPPESADEFVQSLTQLAPVVLFSAAIPGQEGQGHLNEQWPDYWAGLFERHGYDAIDCVRPLIWEDPDVAFWYAQNTLLMVRRNELDRLERSAFVDRVPPQMLRLVHPRMDSERRRARSRPWRRSLAETLRKHRRLAAMARRLRHPGGK